MKKICQIKAQVEIIFVERRKKVKKFAREAGFVYFCKKLVKSKMKSISVLSFYLGLLMCVSIISCQKGKDGNTLEMDDGTNSLAWWFPEKDSINHNYVVVAEDIWMIGQEDDSANVSDVDSLLMWQEKCQKQLVACYELISPNAQLTDAVKADSMLLELEKFFGEDTDDSTTMGRIAVEDLLNSFNRYRCIALSHEIMKYNKEFKAEMQAWKDLQKKMKVFFAQVTEFRKSGNMPLSVVLMTGEIYQTRMDDLQRILSIYKRDVLSNDGQMMEVEESIERYAGAVDEVINMMKKEPGEDLSERQASLYNKVLKTQQSLKEKIYKWISIRKKVLSKPFSPITASFVNQLSEIMAQYY